VDESLPDPRSLSDDKLKKLLNQLSQEEESARTPFATALRAELVDCLRKRQERPWEWPPEV